MKDKKLNLYKIIWLFFVGCVLGFILETIFYIIKYGSFVNKQGLIIGPFKPIYGIGIILISGIFNCLKKEKKSQILLLGIIIGTLFEYLCSYFLEKIWGFYIWDYSSYKYNLNGRIYLPYCFLWGIISVLWYSYFYPVFLKIYYKFESKKFKIITVLIGAFFVVDIFLTGLVYFRMKEEDNNNKLFQIVDKMFPPNEVKTKFAKVRKLKNKNNR